VGTAWCDRVLNVDHAWIAFPPPEARRYLDTRPRVIQPVFIVGDLCLSGVSSVERIGGGERLVNRILNIGPLACRAAGKKRMGCGLVGRCEGHGERHADVVCFDPEDYAEINDWEHPFATFEPE